jgi:16S rRNA processing protein RimM
MAAAVPAAPGAETIVVMAQVLAPYGVRGWVRLRPFTDEPDALLHHRDWWVKSAGMRTWQMISPRGGKVHSGALLAQLDGVETREAAMTLRGAQIGLPRSRLPAPEGGEIYWADLVGLEVVNREGVGLGRVAAVEEYGAHPVLRVACDVPGRRGDRLIPYVAAHVDGVDLAAQRIEVDWQPEY